MNSFLGQSSAWVKEHRGELIIFFAVFGVRFLYSLGALIGFGQDAFVSFLDAEVFVREADNLLNHGVMSQFVEPPYLPDPLRTPLYLWFLALFLKLKFSLFGIVTVQNVLIAGAGVLVYRLGRLSNKASVGMIAGLLFAVEPGAVYWSNLLMSDNLFAALLVLSVYLFLTKRLLWFSAVFALATLARPVGLYVFPIFLLGAIFFALDKEGTLRERLGAVAWRPLLTRLVFMSLIFAALISPWMVRNKILFDHFELSTAGWLNLYIFTVKEFSARQGIPFPMPAIPEEYHPGAEKEVLYNYEFEAADFFRERTFSLIKANPLSYIFFHLSSGIRGIHNHDYRYLLDHVVTPLFKHTSQTFGNVLVRVGGGFWWLVYAGACASLFCGENRRVRLFLIILILYNALLIGYNGLISSGGRYNMVFAPLWFLLAASGVYDLYHAWRAKSFQSQSL